MKIANGTYLIRGNDNAALTIEFVGGSMEGRVFLGTVGAVKNATPVASEIGIAIANAAGHDEAFKAYKLN